jgi:hypothetical protein
MYGSALRILTFYYRGKSLGMFEMFLIEVEV